MPVGIVIFDNDTRLGALLTVLVRESEEFVFAGKYKTGNNIFDIARTSQPAIVLLDMDMQTETVIKNIKLVKDASSDTGILLFSAAEEEDKIYLCLCAGANGFLPKYATKDSLHCAISLVLNGGAPISPSLAMKLFNSFHDHQHNNHYELSHCERSVLNLLSRNHGTKQIAEELNMATEKIRVHIKNIFLKLRVSSRKEAIAKAHAENII